MTDEAYMRLALKLAARGRGKTSPNPMVGAVLVKRGRIIGQGYHRGPGTPHAEIMALRAARGTVANATLYTNLEPCCHTSKKTPPCTRELIGRHIKKVVVAMRDPNPLVCGRGLKELKKAGMLVREGLLGDAAHRINEAYAKYITRRRPFVILKIAQSLDGKIATAAGESRWITSRQARAYVHRLRSEVDAVMVGSGTILRDDPQLTARIGKKKVRQPIRVVVDSRLRIPRSARVLRPPLSDQTILATTSQAPLTRIRELEDQGLRVIMIKEKEGQVDLQELMRYLAEMEVTAVMIEGGSELNASAVRMGIVDKVLFFIAPILLGGKDAISSIGGTSLRHLYERLPITDLGIRRIGPDLMVEGYLSRTSH